MNLNSANKEVESGR